MAKTPKSHPAPGDEEYKFSEEEHPALEPIGEKPKRNYGAILKNRRVIAIVVVIIAIFVVYQYLNLKTKAKPDIGELATQASLGQSANLADGAQHLPVTTTTTTTVQTPAALAALGSSIPESTSQGNALNKEVQQNQAQIQQLQNNIQQLQVAIGQLSGQIANAGSSLNASRQVSVCKAPLQELSKGNIKQIATTATTTTAVVVKIPTYPIYTVRAIIPGRAWLQVKRNHHVVKLVSVKVGDFLPGYGRIQAMNPYQGKVWTSSGKIIVVNYDEDTAIQI